jgi:hypothetical protein
MEWSNIVRNGFACEAAEKIRIAMEKKGRENQRRGIA